MNTYSIYRVDTGLFTGIQIQCASQQLDVNVPAGASAMLGAYLPDRHRVVDGLVETHQPAAPSDDYVWDESLWAWVYVPPLAELRARKLQYINAACAAALATMTASYPSDEIQSWPKQEAEARAYAADPDAPTPLLAAMATARGIDLAELAGRVIAKADYFAGVSGALIGKRQRCEDLIDAATTQAELDAVEWA